jgi:hypothetical protein
VGCGIVSGGGAADRWGRPVSQRGESVGVAMLYFAPHALHYIIVAILCICARSRRAGIRGADGASSSRRLH